MVVGGRALEEDEEGSEEPDPRPGNFAFYNTKASEYLLRLSWICQHTPWQIETEMPRDGDLCKPTSWGVSDGSHGAAPEPWVQPEPHFWSLLGPRGQDKGLHCPDSAGWGR